MIKIAKLTWLHNYNYGSILQAYALHSFLEKNGYFVEDIDYNPTKLLRLANWFIHRNSFRFFKEKIMFKKIHNQHFEYLTKRKNSFDNFISDNIAHSSRMKNRKQLEKYTERFDVVLCGSDQIWNPGLYNPIFFLSFVQKGKKKVSYGPSLGVSTTTKHKTSKIKNLLSDFDLVSIREKEGMEFLKSNCNISAEIVVDPTMLISKSEWKLMEIPVLIE